MEAGADMERGKLGGDAMEGCGDIPLYIRCGVALSWVEGGTEAVLTAEFSEDTEREKRWGVARRAMWDRFLRSGCDFAKQGEHC